MTDGTADSVFQRECQGVQVGDLLRNIRPDAITLEILFNLAFAKL